MPRSFRFPTPLFVALFLALAASAFVPRHAFAQG